MAINRSTPENFIYDNTSKINKNFVYKNSLAIGMILMIISILYLHLNKWYSTNKQNLTSAFFTYKGVDEFERY